MSNAVLEQAIILHAAGYPVLLTDEHKNPGIVGGDWSKYEWTAERFADWLRRKPKLQLGLKLWPIVDIEIDAPEGDDGTFVAEAIRELQALSGGVKTATWKSRRGQHWLFTVSEEQKRALEELQTPAVIHVGKLEVRLGVGKAAQSLIPPSTTDGFQRQWVNDLQDTPAAPLPASLFAAVKADAEARLAKQRGKSPQAAPARSDRPGDIFNESASWDDILIPHGWKPVDGPERDVRHWTRPGKKHGVSATTGFCKTDNRHDCFFSFSTATEIAPFEGGRSYSKFEAITALEFDGDYTAASAELARRGFTPDLPDGSEFDAVEDDEPVRVSAPSAPISVERRESHKDFDDAVFANPIGRYVLANDPHTEADRGSVFMQSLEIFGNWMGKDITFRLNNSVQYANGYLAIVGKTALGRKGTALSDALAPYKLDEPDLEQFVKHRVRPGISSGEGLIQLVADGTQFTDGRLLVPVQELHRLMSVLQRTDSTLSSILREAYDGGTLAISTRVNPIIATQAHISLIIHTTQDEFRETVKRMDIMNGLLNRVMFYTANDGKALPNPSRIDSSEIEALAKHLIECKDWAFNAGNGRQLYWSEPATRLWEQFYLENRRPTGDPLNDALLARTPVHVIRNAMRFAALDMTEAISLTHLETSIEIWGQCRASAAALLQSQNPLTDDREKILSAIRDSGTMTRTEIFKLFNNKKSASDVTESIEFLIAQRMIKETRAKRGNRSVTVWAPLN